MCSKRCPSHAQRLHDPRPPSPPSRTIQEGCARRLARTSLAILLGLGAAGLLPGLPCARAEERLSAHILNSPETGPGSLKQGAHAVPGTRTELEFVITCGGTTPTSWCAGGRAVAEFGASQGKRIIRAWTRDGVECLTNDWYLACPLPPAHMNEQHRIRFVLEVDPWDYAASSGIMAGADGLPLPPTPFSIEMHGEGSLRIGTPEDIATSRNAGLTCMDFVNDGPSMNRGVTFRFGPFPPHLVARMLNPDLPCTFTEERYLQCGPVNQMPDTRGMLMLAVHTAPPLPPLPTLDLIWVKVTSDLTPIINSEFTVMLLEPPPSS